MHRAWLCVCVLGALLLRVHSFPRMSDERVVFQTEFGDIEFGFYPEVAPVTTQHIFKLNVLGAFQSNHIFRVDKGFVAQVADVIGGRTVPVNSEQQAEAEKTVPLEVHRDVKHVEGVVSMGRFDDPNSGKSSFSILLGAAPHLDMHYTIFGKVTRGMPNVHKMESLETRREGIFVMPLKRITILGTYWYNARTPISLGSGGAVTGNCDELLEELTHRFNSQSHELERIRKKCLPGN